MRLAILAVLLLPLTVFADVYGNAAVTVSDHGGPVFVPYLSKSAVTKVGSYVDDGVIDLNYEVTDEGVNLWITGKSAGVAAIVFETEEAGVISVAFVFVTEEAVGPPNPDDAIVLPTLAWLCGDPRP